jgi:hypothetical protein
VSPESVYRRRKDSTITKRKSTKSQTTTHKTYSLDGIDQIAFEMFEKEFKDIKGVIRIRKSKKDRRNDQMKKDKRTNNDLQNTTHKTKDRVTRTPLKTGGELRCSGRVGSSCFTSGISRVNLVTTNELQSIYYIEAPRGSMS